MNIERYKSNLANSPFSRSPNNNTTIGVGRLFSSLSLYRDEYESSRFTVESSATLMEAMTPQFQRENTKWSKQMQASFVENVVSGFRSDILLYYISNEDAGCSYILDGLQRLTALGAFVNNQLPIFGDNYYSDIVENVGLTGATLTLKVYEFPDHASACRHYIAMNKNITHSPQDLESAYLFLENNQ